MDLTSQKITVNSDGAAKQTIKLILHTSKPKKANHIRTPSNVQTAVESIKQMQQHVHSGKIGSIKNGSKRNIQRSMKTGSSQFVQLGARKQNNDCEQTQYFFRKCPQEFLNCQLHSRDS